MKALQIIHKAMLAGQLLCAAVFFYLLYSGNVQPTLRGEERMLQVAVILVSVSAFFLGNKIFNIRVMNARDMQADTPAKFIEYRTACIIQWALLEGASLFSSICFFLTGNYAFLALALALMLFFAMQSPTKAKAALLLQVSEEEL